MTASFPGPLEVDDSGRSSNSGAASAPPNPLLEKLASVLPQGYCFGVYHLSTPPTRTDALYSAPPGERPDKTYWENHFLALSIDAPAEATVGSKRASPGAGDAKDSTKTVFVLALEVFIFTTAYSTTLFVSKADSTGYLPLLNVPRGTPSPIREVTTVFLSHLLEHRRRTGIPSVVSLFARAQDQYLFPLSVENKGKHVLDDRGLVKWWCRVLDPLLGKLKDENWESVKGYLTVPGLEQNETRFFLPRTTDAGANWVLGHPMDKISHYSQEFDWVPPRCLIPRYPDDPKSRFRDELDDESLQYTEATGRWNSIRSLDQFWEMMAYRQECSSGRLTGFIWVVFEPLGAEESTQGASPATSSFSSRHLITPTASFDSSMLPPETPPRRRSSILAASPVKLNLVPNTPTASPSKLTTVEAQEDKSTRKKKLTGPIIPRLPRVKRRMDFSKLPISTPFYYWPVEGRGEVLVEPSDYKRIVELLLHLNFKNLKKANSSTMRWVDQVVTDGNWGRELVGRRPTPEAAVGSASKAGAVTNITSLVRKKAKPNSVENGGATCTAIGAPGSGIAGKKAESDTDGDAAPTKQADTTAINILGAGLIRKKPKTA